MKLHGLLEALEEQEQTAAMQSLSFEERIALLVDRERLWRDNQRRARLLRGARLKVSKASIEGHALSSRHGNRESAKGCGWVDNDQRAATIEQALSSEIERDGVMRSFANVYTDKDLDALRLFHISHGYPIMVIVTSDLRSQFRHPHYERPRLQSWSSPYQRSAAADPV